MEYHPDEFIGKNIVVFQAKNKSLEGIAGKILEETKKTFTIKTASNEEKKILKKGCTFTINGQTISGDEIDARPEERIKRR